MQTSLTEVRISASGRRHIFLIVEIARQAIVGLSIIILANPASLGDFGHPHILRG
jgi:hypothetical protein